MNVCVCNKLIKIIAILKEIQVLLGEISHIKHIISCFFGFFV